MNSASVFSTLFNATPSRFELFSSSVLRRIATNICSLPYARRLLPYAPKFEAHASSGFPYVWWCGGTVRDVGICLRFVGISPQFAGIRPPDGGICPGFISIFRKLSGRWKELLGICLQSVGILP